MVCEPRTAKTCPFCGQNSLRVEVIEPPYSFSARRYFPRCSNADCIGHNMQQDAELPGAYVEFDSPEEAEAAWNARPVEAALRVERDEARSLCNAALRAMQRIAAETNVTYDPLQPELTAEYAIQTLIGMELRQRAQAEQELSAEVARLTAAVNELCPALVGETHEQTLRRTISELREEREKYASLYPEVERLKRHYAVFEELAPPDRPRPEFAQACMRAYEREAVSFILWDELQDGQQVMAESLGRWRWARYNAFNDWLLFANGAVTRNRNTLMLGDWPEPK